MLAIPMKPTCAVDMCKPLRAYVAQEFAETDGEETERNLKQFNQLRIDAVAGRSATAESRDGIDLYFSQLRFATTRFPVSESQVRLGFTWFDAFAPRNKVVMYSWKLEQAATLFNAAAMESHAGVQADRAELSGIEAASKHFLRSAQLFKQLREELQPELGQTAGLTMDLTVGGLTMLEAVLCAQAQAVFYEKAVRQKMAPSSVAKVAAGAAQFYNEALDAARGADLLGKLDTSWENNLAYQVQCFAGATQYWQSIKDTETAEAKTEGFAIVVARLELAQAACGRAMAIVDQSGLAPSIKATVQQLQQLVVRNLLSARHDNDMVYHEVAVAPKDLPPIVPFVPGYLANLARPTIKEDAADLFEALVPMRVTAAASEFSAKLDDVVREACSHLDDATAQARSALADAGLPGSVEAHEQGAGIPDSSWTRVARVQQMGGGAALSALLTGNRGAAERCAAQLEQVNSALATEEAEDNTCRSQFGAAAWARPPSAALSAGLREDTTRYARLLAEARRSDDVVAAQLAQADAEGVGAELASTRAALDARMPPPSSTATVDTSALTALLVECGTLLRGREALKEDLNALRNTSNITPLLLRSQTGGLDTADLFEQALAPARALGAKADASVALQPDLMSRIAGANADFKRARSADPATAAREEVMQKLARAVDGFDKLHSDLTSGSQFYTDLTHRVLQLSTTTRDHCEARALQKRDLLLTLQAGQAAAAQTGGDAAMAAALQQQLNVADGGGAAPIVAAAAPAGPAVNVHTGMPVATGQAVPPAAVVPPAAAAPPPMYAAMDALPAAAPPPYPGAAAAAAVPQAAPVVGGAANPQAVQNLVSMGFERGAAEAALVARNGNEQEAINQLLGQ